MLNKILKKFYGKNVDSSHLAGIEMPTVRYVDSLELYHKFKNLFKSDITVHAPEVIKEYRTITGISKANYIWWPGKFVSKTMAWLYKFGCEESKEDETETIEKETSEKDLVSLVSSMGNTESNHISWYIKEIAKKQFDKCEYFIRELLQNGDGSWANKSENEIHVYINNKKKRIKVEDFGRGMTQEVLEKFFFNLHASFNEGLDHAAGKFGIGLTSVFAADINEMEVDTIAENGEGSRASIDGDMMRAPGYLRSKRTKRGTTITLDLGEKSKVNFDTVIDIIEKDCCYLETPIYVHHNGTKEKVNKPLKRESDSKTEYFLNEKIEGFVEKVKGKKGTLDVLSHRIKLRTIPFTDGYHGVVNSNDLSTIISRDTVKDDPNYKKALRLVEKACRDLRLRAAGCGIEGLVKDYHEFVHSTILNSDQEKQIEWVKEHWKAFSDSGCKIYPEVKSRVLDTLVYYANFPISFFSRKAFGLTKKEVIDYPYVPKDKKGISHLRAQAGTVLGVLLYGLIPFSVYYKFAFFKGSVFLGTLPLYFKLVKNSTSDSYSAEVLIANQEFRKLGKKENFFGYFKRYLRNGFVLGSIIAGVYGLNGALDFVEEMGRKSAGKFKKTAIEYNSDGVNIGTRDSIARRLASSQDSNNKYVLGSTTNDVFQYGKRLTWLNDKKRYGKKIDLHLISDSLLKLIDDDWKKNMKGFAVTPRNLKKYITQNFNYDILSKKEVKGYGSTLEAVIVKRKMTCRGAATYGCLRLTQAGYVCRKADGTYGGMGHSWIQVKENGKWVDWDMTPSNINPRLAALIEKYRESDSTSNSFKDVLMMLGLALVTCCGAKAISNYKDQFQEYEGALDKYQEHAICKLKELLGNRDVDIYYNDKLESNQVYVLRKNTIVLNQDTKPEKLNTIINTAALDYACRYVKDIKIADGIAQIIGGVKNE